MRRQEGRRARISRAGRTVIEALENRRLLSSTLLSAPPEMWSVLVAQPATVLSTTAAIQQQPSIISTSPGAGATGVALDVSITADLNLPNGGLLSSSLNSSTVQLYRTSDHATVPTGIETSGGGDSIVCNPDSPLAPDTQYAFSVTSGVTDVSGVALVPFQMSFTTGTAANTANPAIKFQKVKLPSATGAPCTDVKVGPDHQLYASSEDGRIFRWAINADGSLGRPDIITSLQAANGGPRLVSGFAFDPNSTPGNVILWVSNTYYATLNAPDWAGKITVMSGPELQTVQDAVINLPRSTRDHVTEQPTFGPDGELYFPQGADTAMGAPDSTWGFRREHILSAAILRLDVSRITPGQPLDAKTIDGGGTYNPFAPGAPLTLYATGVRNAFSLLWTHDGKLYAPTNGSSAGGNTPAFPNSINGPRIDTGQPYNGPAVPALTNVPQSEIDWLFNIAQGGYYGHPDPARGEFVLDAGNPGNSTDPNIVPQYPVGTLPDPNYRGYAYNFGLHRSPDGIIEYQDNTFGGLLQGALLVSEYSAGDDIVALTRDASGNIVSAQRGISGFTNFDDPLSLCEDPTTGNIYVAEFGGQRLTLLRPVPPHATASPNKSVMVFNDVQNTTPGGVGSSAPQKLTITNTGTIALAIPSGGVQIVSDPSGAPQDVSAFTITSGLPASIAPGASATITISYRASTIGVQKALLQIQSNDSDNPVLAIELHGIGTTGTGGTNEPSLARILRAFDIPTIVGDGPNDANLANTLYPVTSIDPSSQEVPIQRLVKAGDGPVTIAPLASFVVPNQPGARFGYYKPGNPTDTHELFYINRSDSQAVNPTAQGATSFDPGNNVFGLYSVFPTFTDNGHQRIAYSEDPLNTWDPNVARHFRFFPLENPDGSVVPNAYIFASEDWNVQYDYNDVVGIIRNVKPAIDAPDGPALGLENLSGVPASDRMIFNRIQHPNTTLTDIVHDIGTLRVHNTGDQPLVISSASISGPFTITSSLPAGTTVAPGGTLDITVKFIAGSAPPHTDNQTNDTIAPLSAGGTWFGSLTLNTNDPRLPSKTITLAGYWQDQSEHEEEPGLQTIVNMIAGYGTQIASQPTPNLPEPNGPQYYGEEVVSSYWQQADTSIPIDVRQLASFHQQISDQGQDTTAQIGWISPGSTFGHWLYANPVAEGQTLLPTRSDTGGPADATVNISGTFGWDLDGNYSVDSLNTVGGGGGHHVRFYPLRDSSGNVVPNTYLACLDYGSVTFENFDFQDLVYIISNIKPANSAPTPTDAQASGGPNGITVQWAPVSDASLSGYNIYRGTSVTGPFTKLNSSPMSATSFLDAFAPAGVTSYYRITAVDSNGESVGANASAAAIPNAPTNLAATAIAAGHVHLTWTPPAGSNLSVRVEREALGDSAFVEVGSAVTSTSFEDTSALGNTTYVYQIRAENSSGLSPYSDIALVTTPAPVAPSAPTGLIATTTMTQVTLSWTASTGDVSRYHVERMDASGGSFAEVGTSSTTSFTDTSVTAGSSYVYRVRAENGGAFSDYSNTVNASPAPPFPSNLSGTAAEQGIVLTWTPPGGTVVGYDIERQGPGDSSFVQIAAGVTAATFHDLNVVPLTRYRYRVRAIGPDGSLSTYSNIITVTSPNAPGTTIQTAFDLRTYTRGTMRDSQKLDPSSRVMYYKVTLSRWMKMTGALSNLHDLIRLEIHDTTGATLGMFNNQGPRYKARHTGHMSVLLGPGTYYFRVYFYGGTGTTYTLSVSGHPARAPRTRPR